MEKITLTERPDLKEQAEAAGFSFHTMYGEPYWDETSAYAFTLEQIERDLEGPAEALHEMCREAVPYILRQESLLDRLEIPRAHRGWIAESWTRGEPELYGRFDLAYDGKGPAKLLEYNADTPTSLFEAASFQWKWLEDLLERGQLPEGADQFNGIHEALVNRFREIIEQGENMHFTSVAGSTEDYGTVETLAWMANEAGIIPHYTELDKIGLTEEGQFADNESRVIGTLFKLYPWEDLLRDDFAAHLASAGCRFVEPPWKALLSNKGLLPVLWEMFPDHPNLLPAYFANDVPEAAQKRFSEQGVVEKPIFSREGQGIKITVPGLNVSAEPGPYDSHPKILQAYHPLPEFDGFKPVIGLWMAGGACCGMGIREDKSAITGNLSRFKPHFIRPGA